MTMRSNGELTRPALAPRNIFEDAFIVMLLLFVCSAPALLTAWWGIPVVFGTVALFFGTATVLLRFGAANVGGEG